MHGMVFMDSPTKCEFFAKKERKKNKLVTRRRRFSESQATTKKVKFMLTRAWSESRVTQHESFSISIAHRTLDTINDPVLSFRIVSQKGVEFIVAICENIR